MRRLIAIPCARLSHLALLLVTVGLGARNAHAGSGFALERYNPTNPGEASFWVDNPDTGTLHRRLHVGLDFDYAHNPLVVRQTQGTGAGQQISVITHQLVGHVQAAVSLAERVTLGLDVPLVLVNEGNPIFAVAPGHAFSVGDVRLGALVRIAGGADGAAFGVYASAQLFVPLVGGVVSGDRLPRLMPKLIIKGDIAEHFAYGATLAALVREQTSISALPEMAGNTVSSEVQLGLNLAYVHRGYGLRIGPEAVAASGVGKNRSFGHDSSSVEILGAIHYAPTPHWRLGLAAGGALLSAPGTPDFRVLLRLSWTPNDLAQAAPEAPQPEAPVLDVASPPQDALGIDMSQVASPPPPPPPEPVAEPAVRPRHNAPVITVTEEQIVTPLLRFKSNKAQLLPSSLPVLEALIATLDAHPEIKHIVIEGHTDNSGKRSANKLLSERRARAVMRVLVDGGIDRARLQARGFGDTQPRFKNDTAAHRAANRRVAFRIVH